MAKVFAKRADQLLRIRYYTEGVRAEFAKRHGDAVKDGFAALGLTKPDFATLNRREALTAIAEFEARLQTTTSAPEAAAAVTSLLRGLRDLDPTIIDETHCRPLPR